MTFFSFSICNLQSSSSQKKITKKEKNKEEFNEKKKARFNIMKKIIKLRNSFVFLYFKILLYKKYNTNCLD